MAKAQAINFSKTPSSRPERTITASALKMIALVCMLIDHIGYVIIEHFIEEKLTSVEVYEGATLMDFPEIVTLYGIDLFLRMIGRIAFPIFAFLLIEGYMHTRSIKKYALNLFIFALISEIPFNLVTSGKLFELRAQSIMVTLLIGLIVVVLVSEIKSRVKLNTITSLLSFVSMFLIGFVGFYLLTTSVVGGLLFEIPYGGKLLLFADSSFTIVAGAAGAISLTIFLFSTLKKEREKVVKEALSWFPVFAGILLADFMCTDYSGWGVFTIALMYFFYNKGKMKAGVAGCISLIVMDMSEATALLMLLPLSRYNGERGKQNKYLFYIFYPAHLLLLYGIYRLVISIWL